MAEGAVTTNAATGSGWISDALNGGGGWSLRSRIPYVLGFMMLFDSWDSVVVAFTLPAMRLDWDLSPIQAGWLISSGYAGQFVGAIVFGLLAERYGRLPVLRPLVIIMGLLAIVCAIAGSYTQLIVTRFVQGIAIGGALPIAICYVNEVAPTATRGKFFGTFQFLMLSGFGLASLASIYVVPELGWRVMFALGAIPLFFVPYLFGLPESPRWLEGRGRLSDAAVSLIRLGSATPGLPAGLPAESAAHRAERVPVKALIAPDLIGKTTITLTLWFLTSLVSYGLLNWVPTIYVEMFAIPMQQAFIFNSIVSVSIFILPIMLRQTIDRVGRRPPVMLGSFIGGIALLGLVFAPRDGWALVVGLMVVGQIGISVGSMILWPYTAETFTTRVRSLALGISSSTARGASMLTPLVVGGVLESTGSVTLVFLIFGVLALVVATLWWLGTTETAGREIDA